MIDKEEKRDHREKIKQETRAKLNEAYDRLKEERLQHRN